MRLVIGCRIPSAGGGVRTYVETLATALQRAGHDVTVFSLDSGDWTEWFGDRGIRTVQGTADLPAEIDFFLVQDQPTAYDLLDARPDVPQAFVWHGLIYDVDLAPQLDQAISVIFALYGGRATRIDAASVQPPIVELKQPLDLQRFSPHSAIGDRPTRAVAVSNYLVGQRREALLASCRQAGIELELFGVNEPRSSLNPEIEMNSADIVIGKGRVIAEALACGRAAYVYDTFGCDGWVTPENFDVLVGLGFSGTATNHVATAETLTSDLTDGYKQSMGIVNRELALANYSAARHAGAIVKTLRELAPQAPAHNDAAFELARISRTSWAFESELHILRHKLNVTSGEAADLKRRLAETEGLLAKLTGSQRWRLVSALLAPFDALRRKR